MVMAMVVVAVVGYCCVVIVIMVVKVFASDFFWCFRSANIKCGIGVVVVVVVMILWQLVFWWGSGGGDGCNKGGSYCQQEFIYLYAP